MSRYLTFAMLTPFLSCCAEQPIFFAGYLASGAEQSDSCIELTLVCKANMRSVAHRTASKSADAISTAGSSKLRGSAKDRNDGANGDI